jgi:hypothetical protein
LVLGPILWCLAIGAWGFRPISLGLGFWRLGFLLFGIILIVIVIVIVIVQAPAGATENFLP